MGKVRVRPETGRLQLDFGYKGARCREQTALEDTSENRKKVELLLKRIEAEITLGTFNYQTYFPGSKQALKFETAALNASKAAPIASPATSNSAGITFKDFADEWFGENEVRWRRSQRKTVRSTIDKHLIPAFGDRAVDQITKADILKLRSSLAKVPGRKNKEGLSTTRINHILTPLRMILNEAADRFNFSTPYQNIKSLKVARTDIDPFTLDEVNRILATVRPDFTDYYIVRFFTGMRTGEIDGLKWKYVDFARRCIMVRETIVMGEDDQTKTDGSRRDIVMSEPVFQAMQRQYQNTGKRSVYVFCNREGLPLDNKNVTNRVWYPLLRHLGLTKRRPYQTRHTAATLWLGAGENPEWIARQLGHTTTEMLFRVYSRYVPNLTRQDGSAFERLLASSIHPIATKSVLEVPGPAKKKTIPKTRNQASA
ncbi:site-specific integrase [Noviherbaspirillum sedimenti]|uniref:Site-specific integrase n=1 Tax=Noviherbaspirillum sedimenti TaxID=2320865 RepID=A0A3A3G4U8_9BURK|nr:site-specific integrase [Noviherbaspirillum sedimenti]RJG02695.1 site-specific integrase [Noviherbaspirillum sedimenti]